MSIDDQRRVTIRARAGLYSLDRTVVLSWLTPPLTHYCGVGGPKMDLKPKNWSAQASSSVRSDQRGASSLHTSVYLVTVLTLVEHGEDLSIMQVRTYTLALVPAM